MFEDQIQEIENAMMAIHNSQWDPEDGDPRNLDPEDEPLASMTWAIGNLQSAVEDLDDAVSAERRRRSDILDNMDDKDYERWEADVRARNG